MISLFHNLIELIYFVYLVSIPGYYITIKFKLNIGYYQVIGLTYLVIYSTLFFKLNENIIYGKYFLLFLTLIFTIAVLFEAKKKNILYKNESLLLIIQSVILIVICLPAFIGGSQFYSFRGNWWDHFNYISGYQALKNYTIFNIKNINNSEYLYSQYGGLSLTFRPVVVYIWSLYGFASDIFLSAYLYLCCLLSFSFRIMYMLCLYITNNKKNSILISSSIIFGYWGQIYIDTAVWSHILSFGFLIFGLFYILTFENQFENHFKKYFIIFPTTAFIITYPEIALYSFSIIGLLVILVETKYIIYYLKIIILSIVFTYTLNKESLDYMFGMFMNIDIKYDDLSKTGILYFGQPYFAYDFTTLFSGNISYLKNILINDGVFHLINYIFKNFTLLPFLFVNTIPVLFGFYGLIDYVIVENIIFGLILSSFLLIIIINILYSQIRNQDVNEKYLLIILAHLILTTLLLFSLGKYWEITKALSYSGPLICLIFFSIIGSKTIHSKKMTTLLIIFFLSNFLFAAKRISFNEDGIGHKSPFPSIIRRSHKTNYRFFMPTGLNACKKTYITEANENLIHYLLNLKGFENTYVLNEKNENKVNLNRNDCFLKFKKNLNTNINEPKIQKK